MTRLLIFSSDAEVLRSAISRALPGLDIAVGSRQDLQRATMLIEESDILMAWRFPRGFLDGARRLQWLQCLGSGVDHLFDLGIPRSVVITRLVGSYGTSISEYVIGYCRAISLDIRRGLEQQRRREWRSYETTTMRGRSAVVVGLGHIGREICTILRRAELRVLGVSRTGQVVPEADEVYPVPRLKDVLPAADFLVLAVPLTPATRGLVAAPELALLHPCAWLINVSRGPVVVEGDLLSALRHQSIGGAVLDVFDQEPLPAQHPYWTLPNVIVTPHNSVHEDIGSIAMQFAENFRRYEAGQNLLFAVDRDLSY